MKLFALGKFSIYLLLPFFTPIFIIVCKYIRKNATITKGSVFFQIFFMYIGMALNGVFMFIAHSQQKTKRHPIILPIMNYVGNQNAIRTSLNPEMVKREMEGSTLKIILKSTYFTYFLICMNSFLDLVSTACIVYLSDQIKDGTLEFKLKMSEMIFIILFSYLIFKTYIFKHKLVAIGLIIISFIWFFIFTKNFEFVSLFYILSFMVYALIRVIDKWVMEYRNISPYALVTWQGISGIVYCLVITIINLSASSSIDILYEDPSAWTRVFTVEIAFYLILMISCTFINIGIALTNYYFNPTMKCISDIISTVVGNIVDAIVTNNYSDIGRDSFGYVLIIIASLLYSELIVCNFWGLNYNSRYEIEKRSRKDYVDSEMDEIEEIDSNISLPNKEELTIYIR